MQIQIPNNWQKVKTVDLCVRVTDGTHDTPSRLIRSDHPLITSKQLKGGKIEETDYYISDKDFFEVNRRSKVDQWDVLFGMIGTVGDVVIVKDKFPQFAIKNVGLFKTGGDEIVAKWLYYFINSPQGKAHIRSVTRGTSQGYVPLESLREFPIVIPGEKNERNKIISILSAFDDKITINNKIAKTLEEIAQVIFKEWFVKFRFPGYEKVKFVNSELGEIPNDWAIGKIKQLITVVSGYPFSSKLYHSSEGIGIVTIKNVQDGKFITECDSFIKEEKLPRNFNLSCSLTDGEVILSLTGNVGRVCFVYGGKFLLNQRVAKLAPKRLNDLAYCYFMFRQKAMQNYMVNMAKGSAQPNLSPVELSNTKFVIPSDEILDLFSKVAGPIYAQLLSVTNQNLTLAKTRDLLLPKLMRGEIRL